MKQNKFPPGWDEERVQKVIDYYENQTEDEAVTEAEAGLQDESITLMEVPTEKTVHGPIPRPLRKNCQRVQTTKV